VAVYTSTMSSFFFFTDPATTDIYTLSLHDALPISHRHPDHGSPRPHAPGRLSDALLRLLHLRDGGLPPVPGSAGRRHASADPLRSEEHTSELQSRRDLVCRLLLEKKKKTITKSNTP